MKNNVKRFGQFVNERFGQHGMDGGMGDQMHRGGGEAIHGVQELAIFNVEGMYKAGSLYLVQADETIEVDFPENEISDEPEAWQEYVCGIAKENGVDAVFFIEDSTIVKC